MDYQETIEIIQYASAFNSENSRLTKALNTAISAMRELQALHEQGFSLERIKDIDFRKDVVEHINYYTYMELQEELEKYRDIGTLEEVQEAVEKQHPKTPTWDGDGYAPDGTFVWDEWKCPRCGTRYEVEYDDYDYCPNCGQRIYLHADWSEEDD